MSLISPLWLSGAVFQESGMFAGRDRIRLLYPARAIRQVAIPALQKVGEPHIDWEFDAAHQMLVRPPGSALPMLTERELHPDPTTARLFPAPDADAVGEAVDGGLLRFDNRDFFARHQLEITYEAVNTDRLGFPAAPPGTLDRTRRKLRESGAPLRITLLGDSISAGFNATAFVGVEPFAPGYADAWTENLRRRFRKPIELRNRARDGAGSGYALEIRSEWLNDEPDLLVIAFGMNDLVNLTPETFAANLGAVMNAGRVRNPELEFILVTPMYGNPAWRRTPVQRTNLFAAAIRVLAEARRAAVADVTDAWWKLLLRKDFYDLTGNGVNHPNDYGHRIYAAVLDGLLS